jgi:PAS domain S-box-containing protein
MTQNSPVPTAHADDEIPRLIEVLMATERRLAELTGGEVDAVVGRDGRMFLLQRAQEQLRHREAAKQEGILDALPACIALLDQQGLVVSVNKAWRKFDPESAIQGPGHAVGVNYLDICDQARGDNADQAHQVAAAIRRVLTLESNSFSIEYSLHSSTTERWMSLIVSPLTQDELHGAVIMHLDITSRKRAEIRLEELSKKTERRERLLTSTLSSLSDFAYSFDRDGRFLFANEPLLKLWGRTLEEAVGMNFFELGYPEDLASRLQAEVQQVLITGRSLTGETLYTGASGVEGSYEYIFSPAVGPDGLVDFVVGSTRDITSRKRLEEQLRQAHKMEAIGTLAGGIAHDFNNILTAIGGYTELALMTMTANPGVRDHLGAVLQAVKRAADLVKQILTFSHEQPTKRTLIQLQAVVEESAKLLRATMPASVELELVVATDAPGVLADETQIHQILMNLGTNARHALKERVGRIQIKLERFQVDEAHATLEAKLHPGPYSRISVSDTGSGMDSVTLKRIFEPFFTTKKRGEGTGLGLAVVHGIMDSHDGAITVYSHPGEGTVFHLYFPAHSGEELLVLPDSASVPRGGGERILFLDDEEVLVRLGHKTLQALGYEVDVVTDPAVALALVREDPSRFVLVITDHAMPGMSGLQLASELHSIRPDLPIILTTGYSLTLTPDRIKAAGIRRLLPKPTSSQSLGIAVSAVLSGQITNHYGSNPPYR